jgi:hypothetical protein
VQTRQNKNKKAIKHVADDFTKEVAGNLNDQTLKKWQDMQHELMELWK